MENKQALGKELEALAAKEGTYAKGTPEQKIADLYACAIDNKQRNTTARAHLQELTGPIEKARTLPELTAALQAVSAKTGTDIFVGYTVDRLPTGLRYVPRILTVTPSFTRDELERNLSPVPGRLIGSTSPISFRKPVKRRMRRRHTARPSSTWKRVWGLIY